MKLLQFFTRDKSIQNSVGMSYSDVLGLIGQSAASFSGEIVNRDSALRLAAVYACIRILSSSVAALPLDVFKRTQMGSEKASALPEYRFLHSEPNPMMSSFIWREVSMGHVLTAGNAVSVIIRNQKDDVMGFLPVEPEAVRIFRVNGKKYFAIMTSAGEEVWNDEDVIHFQGFGYDGIKGLSPISYFGRDVIGNAQATQGFQGNFYKNGANLGTVLETDSPIEITRQTELLNSFKTNYVGNKNAHKTAILTDGLKLKQLTVNNSDAQLIESLKLQIADIARIFSVPLHMIGELDKATFSNIEQQSIEFVQYSLLPWLKRIEQEINRKLFSGRPDYFCRFNVDGLLRGDFGTRMEGYSKAIANGIFTVNEVRELENFNRIEGADTLRVPLNTAPITDTQKQTSSEPANPKKGK